MDAIVRQSPYLRRKNGMFDGNYFSTIRWVLRRRYDAELRASINSVSKRWQEAVWFDDLLAAAQEAVEEALEIDHKKGH